MALTPVSLQIELNYSGADRVPVITATAPSVVNSPYVPLYGTRNPNTDYIKIYLNGALLPAAVIIPQAYRWNYSLHGLIQGSNSIIVQGVNTHTKQTVEQTITTTYSQLPAAAIKYARPYVMTADGLRPLLPRIMANGRTHEIRVKAGISPLVSTDGALYLPHPGMRSGLHKPISGYWSPGNGRLITAIHYKIQLTDYRDSLHVHGIEGYGYGRFGLGPSDWWVELDVPSSGITIELLTYIWSIGVPTDYVDIPEVLTV